MHIIEGSRSGQPEGAAGARWQRRWTARRWVRVLGSLGVVLGACGEGASPSSDGVAQPAASTSVEAAPAATVHVQLGWGETAGAPPVEWVTDRGYVVRLDEGYVVNASVELVRCATAHTLLDDLRALTRIKVAYAGHDADPATAQLRLTASYVQSLTQDAPIEMGIITPPGGGYCGAFALVAAGSGTYAGGDAEAAAEAGMSERRLSAYVRGTYRKEDSSAWDPFTAETTSAFGQSADASGVVQGTPVEASIQIPSGSEVTLHIARDASHLFDGIELATATSQAIARAVIARYVEGTRVTLAPR